MKLYLDDYHLVNLDPISDLMDMIVQCMSIEFLVLIKSELNFKCIRTINMFCYD